MTQNEKSDYTCCVCKKIFPSIRSLCPHMKTHPDRGWRGLRHPNFYETASGPDSSQLKQQEPTNELKWLATGKRGRKDTTKEKLDINRVPEKEMKLQDSQAGNQTKFPWNELKTEKIDAMLLKEEGILEKDFPEEGEIIEQELKKREASPGSMVDKSQTTQRQYENCGKTFQTYQSVSNHKSDLRKETANDPISSNTLKEEVKEIDFKGKAAREDSSGFDHKESLSPEFNFDQAGIKNMLDFDLNLP